MPERLALAAMGTRFELVLDGDDPVRLQAAGEEALARIREADRRLSCFRRDSLVSRLNAAAGRDPVRVDDEFLDLLEICREVHVQSHGAFDPAVGLAMEALGFREAGGSAVAFEPRPFGFAALRLNRPGRQVALPRGARLDLGAVGKGWALDKAGAVLREAGVQRALLHGGTSTVAALGAPPGQAGWPVAVRAPGGTDTAATVSLRDAALSVSAAHGRILAREGQLLGHVVDPRSGRPVPRGPVAAVVASSATLADAWSTAVLVLGSAPSYAPLDWARVFPPVSPTTSP